jgi:hypothetical protein
MIERVTYLLKHLGDMRPSGSKDRTVIITHGSCSFSLTPGAKRGIERKKGQEK